MSDRRKTLRQGFTTVEVLVALAIVAVLSAIVVPEIVGRIRESRQSALSQTFFGLSQGIAEYRKAVTRYPYELLLLTEAPVHLAPNAKDACGNNLNPSHINNWRGPYVSRQLLSSGIAMGDAHIQNLLRRITVGSSVFLLMDAAGVDTTIAVGLENEFDGTSVNPTTTGTIRYQSTALPAPSTVTTAAPAGMVNLSYSIPIAGC
jgi:prepilin-type N-terminal cleavage/methylation domain-containing protein